MTAVPTFPAMTTTHAPDRPLRYAEVADHFGVSRSTIERIVRRGELATTIIGGRPRILESQVAAYIARQTGVAAAA